VIEMKAGRSDHQLPNTSAMVSCDIMMAPSFSTLGPTAKVPTANSWRNNPRLSGGPRTGTSVPPCTISARLPK
jgi:hypothetical protein